VTVEVAPDPDGAARLAAQVVAKRARAAFTERRTFHLALSKAPPALLEALAAAELPWEQVRIHQVDERIAPGGHPDRNLTALLAGLPAAAHGSVHPMPVEAPDLDEAAADYAAGLPDALDLVHLGLGPDGHTASLVPGDPVLDVHDRPVALTGEYQGRRRMTLTYPALAAARELLWLVTGSEKREALGRLLAGDTSIPATRVENPAQSAIVDTVALAGRTPVR
jgi:6-phosphogluconolactonase